MKQIKSKAHGALELHEDEVLVEMFSALGCVRGKLFIPIKMRDHLVQAYMDSGTVKSDYLYIDGQEISDGLNHNPLWGAC